MDFLKLFLRGIGLLPSVIQSVEAMFGVKSGEQKKHAVLSIVTTAINIVDAVEQKQIVDADGFSAGLFYGLLTGESPEDALKLGWAHGALLTTFPGDTTMATLDQVRAFAKGGSARIQR